ncbi:MAG: hypothetical protein RJB66_1620 [Pseudomonadota bacterium]|jgi:poly-gamma-glutamate synthesis protein (capsule biosynthesis protein)
MTRLLSLYSLTFFFLILGKPIHTRAELIITLGGDLNLNPSGELPDAQGACKHGRCFSWREVFQNLEPLLIGELNFYNLETVVTDGSNLERPHGGRFLFRTHPEGIRYAKKIGLNWVSMANNHVGDYGPEGLLNTLESLETMAQEPGVLFFHGTARTRSEVLEPALLEFESKTEGRVRIAFAAVTFVRNTPMQISDKNPGVIYPENPKDMKRLLKNFKELKADYKVLSIHGGKEKGYRLDDWQERTYEYYLENGDLDLIIGHHPHRVRPVERIGNKVIFYSLGNYLMLGAGSLNTLGPSEDYGLLARLALKRNSQGRLEITKMEAIPLFNMHSQVYPLTESDGRRRITELNLLSREELGDKALTWDYTSKGWGQVCFIHCERWPQTYQTHLLP